MKSIYFITVAMIGSLYMTGCGDDRSHGDISLVEKGTKPLWVYETEAGKLMVENNFVYIPGGFDVDGDGKNEGGFWLSQYEARADGSSNIDVDESKVIDSFKLFNVANHNYSDILNKGIFNEFGLKGVRGKVKFNDVDNTVINVTAPEASAMLQLSQIDRGFPFSLVSKKQYQQLKMLINKNPINSKSKEDKYVEIANSLFNESDEYVPKNYKVKVYDLLNNNKEWTNNVTILVPQDISLIDYNNVNSYAISALDFVRNGDGNVTDKTFSYGFDDSNIDIAIRAASDYLY